MFSLSAYVSLLYEDGSIPERIDRVAAAGYDGFEVYGFEQNFAAIADRRDKHDLEWVYLSGSRPAFTNPQNTAAAIDSIKDSIELANTYDIQYLNVKSGPVQPNVTDADQRRHIIELLEEAGPLAADAGVTLILEPLNTTVDHAGHFTATAAEGAELVRAVDHPNVQLLFDCYHEQIMGGDLIRSFTQHQDIIGHVHIADNPGRHEPGSGEINYQSLFDAFAENGYDEYVGCEFTPSEDASIDTILEDIARMRDQAGS